MGHEMIWIPVLHACSLHLCESRLILVGQFPISEKAVSFDISMCMDQELDVNLKYLSHGPGCAKIQVWIYEAVDAMLMCSMFIRPLVTLQFIMVQ